MAVSYRNTYGDIAAFMWRHYTRQPVILVLAALFLVLSSVALTLGSLLAYDG